MKNLWVAFLMSVPSLAFANVTASVGFDGVGSTLNINGDGADDSIVVTCNGTNVAVNGVDPGTGAAACASINAINVNSGGGNDQIDLRGVLRSGYTAVPVVTVDAGEGDDTIYGSVYNDIIVGGAGNDALHGHLGDDDLTGNEGNDTLHGNEGNDTLRLYPEGSRDHVDGDSGTDTVIIEGTSGADEVQVFDDPVTPETQHNHIDVRGSALWARIGLSEVVVFNLGDGDDKVTATLLPQERFEIHGGNGNDTLTFSGQCAAGTLTSSSYTQPSQQAASFDGFESSTVSDDLVVGTVELQVPAAASTVDIVLNTGAGCAWTASTPDSWITLPQTSGTGPVTLPASVAANTQAGARRGSVSIGGLAVTITQAGTSGSTTPEGNNGTDDATEGKRGCAAVEPFSLAVALGFVLRRLCRRTRRNLN